MDAGAPTLGTLGQFQYPFGNRRKQNNSTNELTEFISPNHKDHEEQMVEYAEKAYETTNNELCR